jgi:hypothetical protein
LTSVSGVEAATTRSGLRALLDPKAVTQRREDLEGIPVALLPACNLTRVSKLFLFGPFDTWRDQVEQLSADVRGQISTLTLNGSHGMIKTRAVNHTLSRTQYLNRGDDEPVIDLSVLELFPAVEMLVFSQVRNFDVNAFTSRQWPNLKILVFEYMRIGGNTDWLRRLKAPALQTLDLSGNVIGLPQIEAVVEDLHRNCPRLWQIQINNAAEAFIKGGYRREFWRVMGRTNHPEEQENWHNILPNYNYPRPEVDDSESESDASSNSSENESESSNSASCGSEHSLEVDWVNDFPYYNNPRKEVNQKACKRIKRKFNIYVNPKGVHAPDYNDYSDDEY